jgi:outer membrane protein OmpA-like peptidoglycan-associated protein
MRDGRAGWLLFVLLLAIPVACSAAPSPRAEIETFVERAKGILEEATGVDQARGEFRRLTHALLDTRAAARQALGPTWDARTTAERDEFARAFGDVFERAYLEIVEGQLPRHRAPSVQVTGEDVDGRQALVRTRVTARDGRDVRMDYVMGRPGERWRVNDVVIDGVSLVENYRAQFARVLRTGSYAELLARLHDAAGPDAVGMVAPSETVTSALTIVYFAAKRSDLTPAGRRELDGLAPQLAASGRARIVVEGHADGRGDARSNETLAERRAVAIRQHLVARGIDAGRIEVVAYGDRRPVCEQPGEACWALNRRAEVRLTR